MYSEFPNAYFMYSDRENIILSALSTVPCILIRNLLECYFRIENRLESILLKVFGRCLLVPSFVSQQDSINLSKLVVIIIL